MRAYIPAEAEAKWQKRWAEARLANPSADPSKPKFMMIFAYPGVSGYLHIGHMRGYTYTDVITRYKRMTGHNVLFPAGAHATGNLSIALARKVEKGDANTLEYLRSNGCPEEEITKLKDPMEVVRYFSKVYEHDYWRKFGFLIDFDRFTTTVNPDYMKFIQWQFLKLKELGLLVQQPYYSSFCVNCGPVAIDASETDLSKGGNAEKQEYTLLKFRMGDLFVIAATLRPETVYGQTNFWADPSVEYAKVRVGTEIWVVSKPCAEKMAFQKEGTEVIGSIPGKELIGKMVTAPMIHREIPILPSRFCDANVGTGLVTSVPSDAPYDWMGLVDLAKDPAYLEGFGLTVEQVKAIQPIPIIESKDWGKFPALKICEDWKITSSTDPKLEEATKEIYSAGFHTGRMLETCAEYKGMRVEEAKDAVKARMLSEGEADTLYDLSEEVVCRCGGRVVIKQIPDQWFIDYANQDLKDKAKDYALGMNIYPRDYYDGIGAVLDWFDKRSCVRKGNWLGTPFPLDPAWTIEAISDSTLYPLFYLYAKFSNAGRLKPEQMTEAFFDYTALNRGKAEDVSKATGVSPELLAEIKSELKCWYPLDMNLGGKEHKTVHFPAFLMNHVAILPGTMWPRGIYANWYIQMAGGKISKSKGGAQPIPGAAERYSVDGMRLYYAHVASPFVDVEWDDATVLQYRARTEKAYGAFESAFESGGKGGPMGSWLLSRMNEHVGKARAAMDSGFDIRAYANIVFFDMLADLRWAERRGGCGRDDLIRYLRAFVLLACPVAPHLAEQMWEGASWEGMASSAQMPAVDGKLADPVSEKREEYLRRAMADVEEILNFTKMKPQAIHLFTPAPWKREVLAKVLPLAKEKGAQGLMMKAAMEDPKLRAMGKDVTKYVGGLQKELAGAGEIRLAELANPVDDFEVLSSAAQFLSAEWGVPVTVTREDDPAKKDPMGKAGAAKVGRPAIWLEG